MTQPFKEKKVVTRADTRNPTEATIICRPYASSGAICASDGIMRNFSSGGAYIETSHNFKTKTILILRVVRYPSMSSSITDLERPRSICLAQVKWRQVLAEENAIRYGIGLKYLD